MTDEFDDHLVELARETAAELERRVAHEDLRRVNERDHLQPSCASAARALAAAWTPAAEVSTGFRSLSASASSTGGDSGNASLKIADSEAPPVAVTAEYFRLTRIADRIEQGFEAIAAKRDWFRAEFERSPEHPRRAAFEIQPFLRRPALRQQDGRIVVLAPRAIEGWLSATGAYYRFFDIARDRSEQEMERFRRFNGWIQERYVRHLVHVAHPHQNDAHSPARAV